VSKMLKSVPFFLIGAIALLLSACGGGSQKLSSVLAPPDALAASADKFSQDVSSMSGAFTMKISGGGSSGEVQGDYEFEAPDKFHMTMDSADNELEMLMLPPDFYLRIGDRGWYQLDANTLGVDFNELKKYADSRGLVDYGNIAKEMKGISQLPNEEIDGKSYAHYGGDLDFSSLADELPEGAVDSASLETIKQFIDNIRADVWVEEETYLPRRFNMAFIFSPGAGDGFEFEISMDMLQYNQSVDIPAAPSNAQPLSELTTGQ
jgi:hypothetical protein